MILWTLFIALILGLLVLDLGVFHRRAHVIAVPEALRWSAFWIGLGLAFGVVVYFLYDRHWLGMGMGMSGGDPLTGFLDRFRYLKPSLALVLAFVGAKMLAADFVHVPALASLGVIAVIMGVGVAASLRAGDDPPKPLT